VTDPDTEDLNDQLAGAVIRISQNFQSGTGHADTLTIGGMTSGALGTGITFSYNSATGVMVLTGANTFDNYEAAIALVRFSTSGDNPTAFGTATSRTIAWSVTDGLNFSDEVDTTVTIAAVNDNPVNNTGGVSATGNEDATFAITGLTIADVDADPASHIMTVTLSVAHGTLTLRTDVSNGLVAGDISGNGTTSVTLTGTLNAINATLADATGLQYHGDLNFNTGFAVENLHIVTTDGGNTGSGGTLGDTDDVTIIVNAVNDTPDVQPDTFSAVAYTENASTTALFAGSNVDTPLGDVDQVTNYFGGSIDLIITGGLVSGDRLQLTGTRFVINAGSVEDTTNGNAVVGAIGATNGTSHVTISSLTAAATPSVVSALLKAFGFDSTSDDPGAGARTVTLTFNDGGNTGSGGVKTDAVTQTVNVTPVNDAPTLTATATNPTFTEAPGAGTQALAVGLFTGAAASTVEAGQTITSFTLTVSGLHDGADETIGAGGLVIGLGADSSGSTAGLSYVSTIVAGVATIVITATAPITAGNLAVLINNITYQNTNTDNPTAGDRVVTLTSLTDSGGGDDTASLAIASTVHVAAVNDAPDATIATDPYSATEQTPLVLKGTGLTITDADAGAGTLTVVLSVTEGELTVTPGDSGVSVVNGNSTGVVVVSGTLAQLTALLAAGGTSNLVYTGTSDTPAPAVILTLAADDGGNSGGSAQSDSDTATISVTAVNDAPVATITPNSFAADPSQLLDLKNSGLSVSDADVGSNPVLVTLTVDHGTLIGSAGGSGVFLVGSGTPSLSLSGTLAQINALLNTDASSTLGFTGTDPINTLTLAINDLGSTGTGGFLGGSDTALIILDKPPVISGAGSSVAYTEQAAAIALETSLGLSDPDSATLNGATVVISAAVAGDVLAAVTTGTSINATYAAGTLTLSGNDTIAHYLTVLSSVTFASSSEDPTDGGTAPSRTITWTVRDEYDVASAPATTTVNIGAINDAPVAVITPASYSVTEQASLDLKGSGLAVGDIDAGAAATVTATLSVGSGKLLVTAGGSGAIVANSGTASVTITGTLAQINALLMTDGTSTLSYINELDGPPASTTLTLAVNDGGNTGSGGAMIASDTASIAIASIDDAPTGLDLDNQVTTLSEAASTKSERKVADIVLLDPDGNTALSLSGADAFLFKIVGDDLVLKAGAKIDFETNPLLDVTVNADGAGAHFSSSMTISLTDAEEKIKGTSKSEHITGTSQAESINGRGGDDTIKGRGGDDTIRGGAGADVVTGGRGEDVFVFKSGDLPKIGALDKTFGLFFGKYDVITDFKPGTDTIDLHAIDANTHRHGNQAFHFEGRDGLSHSRGELVYRFGEDGAGDRATVILGDTNGDGSADFRIVLKGHHTLHAGDFIL
jgi:Ca2+-binding RTX toxin-like protein